MAKLETIEIDATPKNVAAMMQKGKFHTWQDGKWRYSPYGGETAHCNDPTALFDKRANFAGCEYAADVGAGIYLQSFRDGTRGLEAWDDKHMRIVWQLYKADYPAMQQGRDWLLSIFTKHN